MRGTRACAAYCVERATLRVLRVCSVQRPAHTEFCVHCAVHVCFCHTLHKAKCECGSGREATLGPLPRQFRRRSHKWSKNNSNSPSL